MLLTAGADTTIRDVNGDSPLRWASWHLRDRSIIDLLNVDAKGAKWRKGDLKSPLHQKELAPLARNNHRRFFLWQSGSFW